MKQDSMTKKNSFKKTNSPSFIKLAMKNMVRKGNQSFIHFGLTAIGFLVFILILASLGRPNIPL